MAFTTVLVDKPELMVIREDPLTAAEDEFGPSFVILLRNYPLNEARLLQVHRDVLRDRVVPFLANRVGLAEIYAMTDRSGTRQVNYQVAAQRLEVVRLELQHVGVPAGKVRHPFTKAIGEDFWEERASRPGAGSNFSDGRKDEELRTTVIALSPAPIGVPTRIFRQPALADTISFCRTHRQRPGN